MLTAVVPRLAADEVYRLADNFIHMNRYYGVFLLGGLPSPVADQAASQS